MLACKLILVVVALASFNIAKAQIQILTGVPHQLNNKQCEEKCNETYSKESNIVSCNRGCRLAVITEALQFTQSDDLNETIGKCESSCASSYEATKEDITTCQRGCVFMAPILQKRRQSLKAPIDDFFGSSAMGNLFHQIRLPRIFISGAPRVFKIEHEPVNPFLKIDREIEPENESSSEAVEQPSPFSPFGGFGGSQFSDMFNKINSMMHRTMERMHENLPEMLKGSTGKMIVVKSGPGYHETKTYNLGPDGFELEKEQSNDMMDKENPNDKYFNKNDFELIDDKSDEASSEESSEEEEVEDLFNRIDNDHRGVFDVEVFDPINTNNRVVEGPRLPESGLKTRYIHEKVCSQDSSNMKWSDWVSCVHIKIGMPRWLTAATISLGIVFALWLCLAIPQNAPKQKVISNKSITKAALAKAKEAEASGKVISIVSVKTLDEKPPSYDEIGSNLKVNLAPLHGDSTEKPSMDNDKESKA